MDCNRSFVQYVSLSTTLTGLNAASQFWGTIGSYHCTSIATFTATTGAVNFNPTGFKNIDVTGLKIIGQIQSNPTSASFLGTIVDFGFNINLIGTYPLLSANVSNNALPINQSPVNVSLSKFQPDIYFSSPIKSVSNICLQNLSISANNCISNTNLSLFGSIALVVYYRFEGE